MAIARTTAANSELVKPLGGAIIRRYTLGATVLPGEVVAMSADGKIDPADTTSAAAQVVGIAIKGGLVNEIADVVVHGPIVCVTGGTPGTTVHASNTPGEPAESAGTNVGILGWVEAATVIFVRPVSA
jgi:hypothetical protein